MSICQECGMPVVADEYHPYAACLMFKSCHNSDTVQKNLDAVREYYTKQQHEVALKLIDFELHTEYEDRLRS